MKIKSDILLIITLILNVYFCPQISGAILKGTVINAHDKTPLASVNIDIKKLDLKIATDISGTYYIPHLPTGNYDITFSLFGYSEKKFSIDIKNTNDIVTKNIELEYELIIEKNKYVLELNIFSIELKNYLHKIINFSDSLNINDDKFTFSNLDTNESIGKTEIHLQSGFYNEKVKIWLNNILIFDNKITTNPDLGLSGIIKTKIPKGKNSITIQLNNGKLYNKSFLYESIEHTYYIGINKEISEEKLNMNFTYYPFGYL